MVVDAPAVPGAPVARATGTALRAELPEAATLKQVAGTPSYMAPEMALAGGLDARSDVHLLGACLHQVLTGRAPRRGDDVKRRLLAAAVAEAPQYGSEVPEELGAIARTAMARNPERRFATAKAFHDALAAFLEHRYAQDLAREAAEVLRRLERRVAEAAPDEEVQRLAGECRFGFRQALRSWNESEVAREGEQRALRWLGLPPLLALGLMDEKGHAVKTARALLGMATQGVAGICNAMLPYMPDGATSDELKATPPVQLLSNALVEML